MRKQRKEEKLSLWSVTLKIMSILMRLKPTSLLAEAHGLWMVVAVTLQGDSHEMLVDICQWKLWRQVCHEGTHTSTAPHRLMAFPLYSHLFSSSTSEQTQAHYPVPSAAPQANSAPSCEQRVCESTLETQRESSERNIFSWLFLPKGRSAKACSDRLEFVLQ